MVAVVRRGVGLAFRVKPICLVWELGMGFGVRVTTCTIIMTCHGYFLFESNVRCQFTVCSRIFLCDPIPFFFFC
jgi:hypothetical protein